MTYENGTWPAASAISYPGYDGDGWSHSTYSATRAYRLLSNSSVIGSSGLADRYLGHPLRCLYAS